MAEMPTHLPTGTVTFLYTDIEGSTRRWEQHPADMKAAVERHDAILREAIEGHGGMVFRTMGDAFCAVFVVAPDALLTAVDAQRALHGEPWSANTGPINVRMALHTGVGEVRDGDYVGHTLNRVARLLSAAHGGQVLLSRPAHDLVADALPSGVTLRDLGEHKLKDLQRPEYIFQLVIEGLPPDFPPLLTLDRRPNNLPAEPSPFVGRGQELEAVCSLLRRPDVRFVTLTGPGGIGKSRLALEAAAELLGDFRDGAFFVPLAPVSDPQLVLATIAQTLDMKDEIGLLKPADSLKAFIRDKQLLLVLDNFEQVTDAATALAQLLAESPRLKVIVTSQVVLHLRGEHEFAVPPFALPDPALFLGHHPASAQPVETLSQYEAVHFFLQRARQAKPGFALTEQNAAAVAQICYRLDGLPLAIELAAARIKLLPPEAMLARLSSSLRLLVGGARDLPTRQQALRSTIEWSYDLLSDDEKTLFRRLSVFVGGFTLEAAEEVCSGETIDVFDGVSSLVDRSLVQMRSANAEYYSEPRFSMLQTILEYARERLEESGEASAIRERHANYFLVLAGTGTHEGFPSGDAVWLERMEAEQDNLRTALQWCLDNSDAEKALRLSGALSYFWQMHGNAGEERRWAKAALALPGARQFKRQYAYTLIGSGTIGWFQGNLAEAKEASEESAAILREIGDERGLALSLITLGQSTMFLGDREKARSLLAEGLALYRRLGVKWGIAQTLFFSAQAQQSMGELEAARASLEECRQLYHEFSNEWWEAQALNGLGDVARMEGKNDEARRLYQQSLEVFRRLRAKTELPASLHNLGHLAIDRGNADEASALFAESLALHREIANKPGIVESLAGFAAVAGLRGQPARAARLFGASAALRDAISAPIWPAERDAVERNVAAARAELDPEVWSAAWAEGTSMSMETAIEYALQG